MSRKISAEKIELAKRLTRPLWRDLTDGIQECTICERNLRSLKSYAIAHPDGHSEIYAGVTCIFKYTPIKKWMLKAIPDFTIFSSEIFEHNGVSPRNANAEINISLQSDEQTLRKKALTYIELREHKLVNEFKTSFPVLKNYYEKSRSSELDSSDIRHILAIENKVPEDLKLINLLKCYNYSTLLKIAIEKSSRANDNSFLQGIKTHLIKFKKLSDRQKIAVNDCLTNYKLPNLI